VQAAASKAAESGVKAETQYDLARASAKRDYNNNLATATYAKTVRVADAELAYVLAQPLEGATTQWLATSAGQAATAQRQSELDAADDDYEAAAKTAKVTHAGQIGVAQIIRATSLGAALITEATEAGDAEIAYVGLQNADDSIYEGQVSTAKNGATWLTANADRNYVIAAAGNQKTIYASLGVAAAEFVGDSGEASVTRVGSVAAAEAGYHWSIAEDEAQVLTNLAAANPTLDNQFLAAQAAAFAEWVYGLQIPYVEYATASMQAHVDEQVDRTHAEAAFHNGVALADVNFVTSSEPVLATRRVDIAAEGNALETLLNAEWNDMEADRATAFKAWHVARTEAKAAQAVSYAQADKDWYVASAQLDVGASSAALDQARSVAKANADLIESTTVSGAKKGWIETVAASEREFHEGAASSIEGYRTDVAAVDRGSLQAIAPFEFTYSVAIGAAENKLDADEIAAGNQRRTADAQASAAMNDADYTQLAAALEGLHATMNLPWTEYQADRAAAMRDWWDGPGRTHHLALATRLNAAAITYQSGVAAAQTTFVTTASEAYRDYLTAFAQITEAKNQGIAAANETYAASFAGAEGGWHNAFAGIQRTHEVDLATAQRNYVQSGDGDQYEQDIAQAEAQRSSQQFLADVAFGVLTTAAAGARWLAETHHEFVYASDIKAEVIELASALAPARRTFVAAEARRYAELQVEWVDAHADYEVAHATSLAAALGALASASSTPWSTYDNERADADAAFVSAVAPARQALEATAADANADFVESVAIVESSRTIAIDSAVAEHQESVAEAAEALAEDGAAADSALAELGYVAALAHSAASNAGTTSQGGQPAPQPANTVTPQPKDPDAERRRHALALGLPADSPWITIQASVLYRRFQTAVWNTVVGKQEGWLPAPEHTEQLADANAMTRWPRYDDLRLPYAGPHGYERWDKGQEARHRSKLEQTPEGRERLEIYDRRELQRKIVGDATTALLPIVSDGRDTVELVLGEDLIWREKFTKRDYVIQAGGFGVPFIPARAGRLADDVVELAVETAGRVLRRYADDSVEAIRNFEKANPDWRWTKKPTSGENSELLRKNLGEPTGDAKHAHHILASTHPDAEEAREILEHYRIDINSKENGVFLTKHQHEQTKLHTRANIQAINVRIRDLHDNAVKEGMGWRKMRALIEFELGQIKREIVDGKFPPKVDE
jgi:hypothetical protein